MAAGAQHADRLSPANRRASPPLLPPPFPPRSKSEQINSDPNSALGSLPYTAPEVLSNTMKHGHQVRRRLGRGRGQRCGSLAAVVLRGAGQSWAWGGAVHSLRPTCAHTSHTPPPASSPSFSPPQADVWSLGVALFKMCTGLYPFERLEDSADARTAVQVGMDGAAGLGWPPATPPCCLPTGLGGAGLCTCTLRCAAHACPSFHADSLCTPPPLPLQNVLSRIARVEYVIPSTMSAELQDLLG